MKREFEYHHVRRGARARGSVIVLVVAVLALLAVIGTVYIVSARAQRTDATAMQTVVNLDLAMQAANNSIMQRIGDDTLDSTGVVGGYNGTSGMFGTQRASLHTIPEFSGNNSNSAYGYGDWPLSPPLVGGIFYPQHIKDNTWLVSNTYVQPSIFGADPLHRANEFTLLTPYAFNPAIGTYDANLPYYDFSKVPNAFGPLGVVPYFKVVNDPLPSPLPLPNGGTEAAFYDAFINLLPYSEASGIRYRFGLRVIDTSRMANINVGIADINSSDTIAYNGAYFSGYALGQGNGSPSDGIFESGTTATGSPGVPDVVNAFDSPAGRWGSYAPSNTTYGPLSNNGNNGAPINIFAPPIWQWSRQALSFEYPLGLLAMAPNPSGASPFDLGDEIELRTRGLLGSLMTPRPAMGAGTTKLWPNNLGVLSPPSGINLVGNLRRNFFTTWSYSRDLRPFLLSSDLNQGSTAVDAAYTVTSLTIPNPTGPYVWPPFPAKVAATPDVSYYTKMSDIEAADFLTIAATNIATAMEKRATYSKQEARAFAANYLTFRWNGWSKNTAASDGTAIYNLINGPSFIDAQGICLRATLADGTPFGKEYGSATDLAETTNVHKVYLGYAGQPFLNEVAVHEEQVAGMAAITEAAVELYNPYNVALDLKDYVIRVNGQPSDIPLTDCYIPARGYFVIYTDTGASPHFDPLVAGTAQKKKATGFNVNAAGGTIVLLRKYLPRGGALLATDGLLGAVDSYNYGALASTAMASTTTNQDFYIRRDNDDPDPSTYTPPATTTDFAYLNYAGRWLATVQYASSGLPHLNGAAPEVMTLGSVNPGPLAPPVLSLRLYDRYLDQATQPTGFDQTYPQRSVLQNISEFNHIMRIANEIDASANGNPTDPTVIPTDNGVLTQQLAMKITAPYNAGGVNLADTQFPAEAGIHFDFRSSPWVYSGSDQPVEVASPLPPPFKTGDLRAVWLLDCLTFVDRVSDLTIDIGDNAVPPAGNRGLSKLRIPGQINVNTASGEVLASLPVFNSNYRFVGDIMAYRWRTTTDDIRIPAKYRPSSPHDFSDPTKFPGYGIRSLGELNVALTQDPQFANAATLHGRDALWASVYNMCTVRSDTFVVYGYMEAVKANPNVPHNNGTDWYGAVSDDPRGATTPNIRVARRRWIALVDRSQANFNRAVLQAPPLPLLTTPPTLNPLFTGARIIAVKDLPN